jgi:microcompartment protein CcmL/EutN
VSGEEQALGMVEVRGLVPAIGAADTMAKSAPVVLVRPQLIGAGYVTVVARGEIAAVREAVAAGVVVARRLGQLVGSHVIGRPFPEVGIAFGFDEPRPTGHGPPARG